MSTGHQGPSGHGPQDDIALAGEYVVGVLPDAERREAERRIATDPRFAGLVAGWQTDLSELDKAYEPANIPPIVRQRLDKRLFGSEAGASARIWGSLNFWRGLAVASLAVAVAFAAVNTGLLPGPDGAPDGLPTAPLIADLAGDDAPMAMVARYDPESATLNIVPAALGGAEKSLELWAVPGDGVPRSLGLIPADGGTLTLTEQQAEQLGEGVTLAVSLEPAGGSPTGVATGPVLVAGPLAKQ
ncbi:anti-sigma factor [Pseudohoeflea coraliihabitans]|uniref:Anti-sigma factor n=1 Tax=Pseudohoeflea coraliihabitans TaxID=2860393 RepID=A0ABS6WLN2_9HYPH|nr:anti-sigma factor [Pseudohoeflea sp. DP4N28-3]MBW3096866.1 anti-sigma factor [Pseudohoeflea sp. DP4N28-3]